MTVVESSTRFVDIDGDIEDLLELAPLRRSDLELGTNGVPKVYTGSVPDIQDIVVAYSGYFSYIRPKEPTQITP